MIVYQSPKLGNTQDLNTGSHQRRHEVLCDVIKIIQRKNWGIENLCYWEMCVVHVVLSTYCNCVALEWEKTKKTIQLVEPVTLNAGAHWKQIKLSVTADVLILNRLMWPLLLIFIFISDRLRLVTWHFDHAGSCCVNFNCLKLTFSYIKEQNDFYCLPFVSLTVFYIQ